jgi:hypothetical protein
MGFNSELRTYLRPWVYSYEEICLFLDLLLMNGDDD